MTTLTAIIAALERMDTEAASMAAEVKAMIPESPGRDDPYWEAHTFLGGVGSSAKRAAAALRRAEVVADD